jgi:hypothetical protein
MSIQRQEESLSTQLFPVLPLLVNIAPSLIFRAAPSLGCGRGGRTLGGGDLGAGGGHNGEGPRCPGAWDGSGENCTSGDHQR